MGKSFSEIKESIAPELGEFNNYYVSVLQNKNEIVQEAVNYIIKTKGKQLRPMLAILSSGIHGAITKETYMASTVIELTHMSSLIHDDIVDEAYTRRHMLSVNALWRSRKAVLIGDYILSKAMNIASNNNLHHMINDIAKIIESMTVGELIQSDATMRLNITEEEYYQVVKGKTAILIGASLRSGALAGGATKEEADMMSNLGNDIGIIFQIQDDILDYSKNNKSGKGSCNDIKERKITLPLIYALKNGTTKEQKNIKDTLRHIKSRENGVEEVYQYVIDKKGLEEAREKMLSLKDNIIEELNKYPDNRYRNSLIDIVNFICEREN